MDKFYNGLIVSKNYLFEKSGLKIDILNYMYYLLLVSFLFSYMMKVWILHIILVYLQNSVIPVLLG